MAAPARRALDLVVGVASGGMNGIDTYAEAVADAAAIAGHRVLLLVAGDEDVEEVGGRIDARVEVVSLGLGPRILRLPFGAHTQRIRRLSWGLARTLEGIGHRFEVAHLSRPPLAPAIRPFAGRVVVGAWFHPHALVPRVQETWRHTQGPLARRAALTGRSVTYFAGDERGFRHADLVVAPTRRLAAQLAERGIRSAPCPPPARRSARASLRNRPRDPDGRRHLLVVSGDLSHPRKHVAAAVAALGILGATGRAVTLHAIGRRGEALRARALPPSVDLVLEGPMPAGAVREAMADADALVLPSRYEEWGYVAVEALLAGTPVATFPVYPFAEMLEDGLGEVAPGTDPADLAIAVARILDRPRPADLADRAAARFGAEAVGARLTELWTGGARDAASGKAPGTAPVGPGSPGVPTGSPPPPP